MKLSYYQLEAMQAMSDAILLKEDKYALYVCLPVPALWVIKINYWNQLKLRNVSRCKANLGNCMRRSALTI